MPKRTSWRVWVVSLGIFSLASGLRADVVTVNAVGTGGLWSNPNTWSPSVVPNNSSGTTYDVNISASLPFQPPATPNVVVDINPTVDSVTVSNFSGTGGPGPSLEIRNNSTLTAGAVSLQTGPFSVAGITVDSGGTLNATTASVGQLAGLEIDGTATIGSVIIAPCCAAGLLSVGGLANVGGISGGEVDASGTLNIAARTGSLFPSMAIAGGAVTVGTSNLLPLTSQNTLVNNGQIVLNSGLAPYLLIGSPTVPGFLGLLVAGNATYDEVIDSATSFGTLSALALSLDGTLKITLADSYTPPIGQSFVIMSGTGPLSGTFADIDGQRFNNGTEMWDVTYQSNDVVLTAAQASAVPEPSFLVMLGLGLVGIAALSRNRRQQSA